MRVSIYFLILFILACQSKKLNDHNLKNTENNTSTVSEAEHLNQLMAEQLALNKEYYANRNDSFGGWDTSWLYRVNNNLCIYNHSGSFLGAYPSPMSCISMHYKSKLKLVKQFQLPIHEVYVLDTHSFICISMGTERKSGWQSYDEVKRCRILEVKKDSLILSDPIVEVELPYHVQYTEGDKFNIESPSIHFDKETKTIKAVGYSMDWMKFADGINDCTKHLYTFKFSDGRYELLEEEEISEIRKG